MSIRFRLTLVYGALFLLSGAALLVVVYLLVRFTFPAASTRSYLHAPAGRSPAPLPSLASLRAQADRQRDADLHQLLVVSGLALTIMLVVSIGLGWMVAGRVLRPLRTITATARDLSSATLDRRLALGGPDDELKELGDTFDELLGRLERSFASQRQFVAHASHELRTPLTLERALLEAALARPTATAAELRGTCRRLIAVNTGQERLIEALLTLAVSERGLDHREPLDLAELGEHVLADRHDQAARAGLHVAATLASAPAAGDPALAERLIANLADNALRYNTPGGQVEIVTGTESGQAIVSVTNTGPDVPADRIGELFEPFRRLGADHTGPDPAADPGHGLGLSIVAAIATAHGAQITAGPGPGGGLAVTARFPAPGPATAGTGSAGPGWAGRGG
ncbi:MAG: HAMP domain-containing histidine kinase [Actinobacteria bacterium]|nr:HAMP domain-containing histidine kinase [Actinomycetota bacterium]